MDQPRQSHDEQAALWNGPAGQAWVDARELLDQTLAPFADLLVEAVFANRSLSTGAVLDVGCGTGATTAAIARRMGAGGRCVGIDISGPMVSAARTRAEREGSGASFIHADAQEHDFETASFEVIVSRFGVMFFSDPVRAFANLRRAAKDAATLIFAAWRSPAENPFMITAERVAAPLLPAIPPRLPNAPGQFAFADAARVRGILERSGWSEIDIRPIDVACSLPENELMGYLTRLGPLGRSLREVDEPKRREVIGVVRAAFDPFVHGVMVRFTAACWMVEARAAISGL